MKKSKHNILKAIIPVAGIGSRFLPATRVIPKPLLPVLNIPSIEYVMREIVAAGIKDVLFVISSGMESLTSYFEAKPELENILLGTGRFELLDSQKNISSLANISIAYQEFPRGLGDAVLMGKDFVGNEPFAIVLPDDIIWSDIPSIQQLVDTKMIHGGSVIGAIPVPKKIVNTKGIIDGEHIDKRVLHVRQLVEKPGIEQAPSNISIIGRYVLEPIIFGYLDSQSPGAGGEIQLTDAINRSIKKQKVYAHLIEGHHSDTGNPEGMIEATLFAVYKDPVLRALVKNIVGNWD